MRKIWIYPVGLAVLVIAGGIVWLTLRHSSGNGDKITVEKSVVVDLRTLAELCSMDIYREVTVKDTLNGKVILGIQKQHGTITFALEELPVELIVGMRPDERPDTLRLQLPKERVEILESTERNSWRVIDTHSLRLFQSDRMTAEEENIVKRRAIARSRQRLYGDGTVKRARREAARSLEDFLSRLTGHPVIVND